MSDTTMPLFGQRSPSSLKRKRESEGHGKEGEGVKKNKKSTYTTQTTKLINASKRKEKSITHTFQENNATTTTRTGSLMTNKKRAVSSKIPTKRKEDGPNLTFTASLMSNIASDYNFSVDETSLLNKTLEDYENALMTYCVEIYELLSNKKINFSDMVKEGGDDDFESLDHNGRYEEERHLSQALFHLNAVLDKRMNTTTGDILNQKTETREKSIKIKESCDNVMKQMKLITDRHNEAVKTCKKAIATIKYVEEALDDWERWKVRYVSELRVHYDPMLCGGISKPTLDVLSSQSNASKMRLGVMEQLNSKRIELIDKLKELEREEVEQTTRRTDKDIGKDKSKVTNDILYTTADNLEMSRHEREEAHLNVQDKISFHLVQDRLKSKQAVVKTNGLYSNLETSANVRTEGEKKMKDIQKANTVRNTTKEASDSRQKLGGSAKKSVMKKSVDMPYLMGFNDKQINRRQSKQDSIEDETIVDTNTNQDSNMDEDGYIPFEFNPVTSVGVHWEKNKYDTPLDKVNWASKTTVRMHRGFKF